MSVERAFPVVIVDEDVEARHAAGRAVRQLAACLETHGIRVETGFDYYDAARLLRLYHNESCLLVSIDGIEERDDQWEALEEMLTSVRGRNTRLPIFLLGDERTAESVPACVLKIYARRFDAEFPGFETDIHGLRFEPDQSGRRYLVDCLVD